MRRIDEVIVHCTATRPEWWATRTAKQKVGEVRKWHVRDNGWNDIGYHYLIDRDGTVVKGREEQVVGAHVAGHNEHSIGIALFGGFGSNATDSFYDHYTPPQAVALRSLIDELQARYPGLRVSGHNQYANRACPGFVVADWLNGRAMPHRSKRVVGAASIAGLTAAAAQVETVAMSVRGAATAVLPDGGAVLERQSPDYMTGLAIILGVGLLAALGWMLYTRFKDAQQQGAVR